MSNGLLGVVISLLLFGVIFIGVGIWQNHDIMFYSFGGFLCVIGVIMLIYNFIPVKKED